MAITATQPTTGRLVVDWEGYLNLPDDLTHYEIIDGEVIPLASPTLKHQVILKRLLQQIDRFVLPKRLGELLTAPFDFVVRRAPVRTRQPDLFFLSRERLHDWAQLQEQPRLEFAPDLVIEILSPSETYTYWSEKLQDYYALGVPEVWLVDIDKRAIEVQVREAGGYRSLGWFAGEQAVASQVLAGLELKPAEVFAVLDELSKGVRRDGNHNSATDDGTACRGLGGLPEPARRPDTLRNHRRRGDPLGKPNTEASDGFTRTFQASGRPNHREEVGADSLRALRLCGSSCACAHAPA
jgi:Uma2 family endonuclease